MVEQEIENLCENIMRENFPNLAKEIDLQEVQEAQRVQKNLDPRRNTPRYIIIQLSKIKDKERILKAARGKERVTYKGVPMDSLVRVEVSPTATTPTGFYSQRF